MNRAVVYTVDDNTECLLQMVASIRSVRKFIGDIDIFILTNTPRSWMKDIYGAKIIDVSRLVRDYQLDCTGIIWRNKPVSPMLLFRLLIPLVEELKGYDQVLYLDTDTEVWSEKFSQIFDVDLDMKFEAVAVRDPLKPSGTYKRIKFLKDKNPREQGMFSRWDDLLANDHEYVNSGVIVFNIPRLVSGYEERIKKTIDCMIYLKPWYPDQDILNIYYRLKVLNDRRFNHWVGTVDEVYLKHYVGNVRKKSKQYPPWSDLRPKTLDSVKINPNLGLLSGKIDHVYVLINSDYNNRQIFEKWLRESGINSFTEFDTKDSYEARKLLDTAPHDPILPEHMGNWLGHYKCIVDASEKGYDKIAILEDTFESNDIEDSIKSLPDDWDIVIVTGEGIFVRSYRFKAPSSKGYLLSKAGIVEMRRIFESLWDPTIKGTIMRYVHDWLHDKVLTKLRGYIRV